MKDTYAHLNDLHRLDYNNLVIENPIQNHQQMQKELLFF